MADRFDRRYDGAGLSASTARARADADRAAEAARERRRVRDEQVRASARRRPSTAPGATPTWSTPTWGRPGAGQAAGPAPWPSTPGPSAPGPAAAEVVLTSGWDGAGAVHRHPHAPELLVETSPSHMDGRLRLAVEWPGRLIGRVFVEASGLDGTWRPLRAEGTTLPAEWRRRDERSVTLRWCEPTTAASWGEGGGRAETTSIAAKALVAVAGAAWTAWRRHHASGRR